MPTVYSVQRAVVCSGTLSARQKGSIRKGGTVRNMRIVLMVSGAKDIHEVLPSHCSGGYRPPPLGLGSDVCRCQRRQKAVDDPW